jgi:riboflavin kinase / FMN adenylyltransferase
VQIFSSQFIDRIRVPTAIALGNFDGLHLGHQAVIEPILPHHNDPSLCSTLVSFCPHPKEFFNGIQRSLLTPLSEKIKLLEKMGIEQLVLLEFNQDLANLSAAEFIQIILQQKLQAEYVSVGFNFHFGAKRLGTVKDLESVWGDRLSIAPEQLDLGQLDHGHRISSSNIRAALTDGNVAIANKLLGRCYSLTGNVISGDRLGRELGFPTANLELDPHKFLPRHGVYVVRVELEAQKKHLAVMNIGVRPTVGGQAMLRTEVHLLNWQGDLYGKQLTVELIHFLRPESKFDSLDQLKRQIKIDCEQAISLGG